MSETLKPGLDFEQLPEEVKARRREVAAFHRGINERVRRINDPAYAMGGWKRVAREVFTNQETGQIDVIKGIGRVGWLYLMSISIFGQGVRELLEREFSTRPGTKN